MKNSLYTQTRVHAVLLISILALVACSNAGGISIQDNNRNPASAELETPPSTSSPDLENKCTTDRNSEQYEHLALPAFDCKNISIGTSTIEKHGYQIYRKGFLILNTTVSQIVHFEDEASAYKIELLGSSTRPTILVTHIADQKASEITVNGTEVKNIYINFKDKHLDIRNMEVRSGDTSYILYSGSQAYTGISIMHGYRKELKADEIMGLGSYADQGIRFY